MKSRNHRLGRRLNQHIHRLIQDGIEALIEEKKSTYNTGNLALEKLFPSLILCENVAKLLVDRAFKES